MWGDTGHTEWGPRLTAQGCITSIHFVVRGWQNYFCHRDILGHHLRHVLFGREVVQRMAWGNLVGILQTCICKVCNCLGACGESRGDIFPAYWKHTRDGNKVLTP